MICQDIPLNKILLFGLILFVGVGIIYYLQKQQSSKEKYGGPVKNVRYIGPLNDQDDSILHRPKHSLGSCFGVCDTYYAKCMNDYGNLDPQMCHSRFKEICRSECIYSNKHRL